MPTPASITAAFTPAGQYGYSCQTVLSRRVNEFLHPGTYYCWFSVEFDPGLGGNSSNPLWLYQTLSHAVRTGDVNDAKVRQIRMTLLDAVTRSCPIAGSPAVAAAIVHVRHAAVDLFRPQIWRIDLNQIKARATSGCQYPTERKVENLRCREFDIIVE
jgi:hypothetical protein